MGSCNLFEYRGVLVTFLILHRGTRGKEGLSAWVVAAGCGPSWQECGTADRERERLCSVLPFRFFLLLPVESRPVGWGCPCSVGFFFSAGFLPGSADTDTPRVCVLGD